MLINELFNSKGSIEVNNLKPSKKVHDYFPKRDDLPERFYK